MSFQKFPSIVFIASILFSFHSTSLMAQSDSDSNAALNKLHTALDKFDTNQPIAGHVTVSFNDKEGEGKKLKEFSGQVSFNVRDDEFGLTTAYNKSIMEKIRKESASALDDDKADTPTISAVNEFNLSNVSELLSPVNAMKRLLKFAKLDEVNTLEDDKQQLVFSLPMETIITSKRTREYVDDFEGSMIIEMTNEGVPVELSTNYKGSGRAYVVFSLSAAGTRLQKYDVVGSRLVMTSKEMFSNYESTFGKGENSELHLFTPKKLKTVNNDYFAKISKDTSM